MSHRRIKLNLADEMNNQWLENDRNRQNHYPVSRKKCGYCGKRMVIVPFSSKKDMYQCHEDCEWNHRVQGYREHRK